MHLVEEHYNTKIDLALSKAFGIWPHDRSQFVLLRNLLVIAVLVPYLCLQCSVFIRTEYTMTLFVRVMIIACPCIIITVMYVTFSCTSKIMLNLHNQIQEDWMLLRNKLEIDILQKNAHDNQFYIFILFFYSVAIIVAIIAFQLFPIMLDVVFPLDKPRPRKLLIMVEYFTFHDKYFYTKVLHEIVFVVICVAVIFAMGTQILILACHALGMFKIARHRIEYSVEKCVLHVLSRPEREYAICKKIIHAIIVHRRALEFSHIIVSSYDELYCIVIILLIISLTINLYGIIEATTISKNLESLYLCIALTSGLLGSMFLIFYIDQKITDRHGDIFHITYAASWYLMPVSSQKLILFLLQNTRKEFYVRLGYVFISKMDSFATILNTSFSYVAVMCTISQK